MNSGPTLAPVVYEKDGPLAWLTLNRPEVLNAMNLAMRDLLYELVESARDDPDVRVVILKGAGERAFCAGADITEFGSAPSPLVARDVRRQRDLWSLLLGLDKPLIAAIHGFAYGAGCEASLCCDIRVVAEDALFALPEIRLAYMPAAGGTQLLPRTIPPGIALEMILTGEPINASLASNLGLVQQVVPPALLVDEARRMGLMLATRPPEALRAAKLAITQGLSLPLHDGLALEASLAALLAARKQGVARGS